MFKNCLIVEDQTMFAETLSTTIVSLRLAKQCTIATSLSGASRLVASHHYDLVVADLLFPEGNSNAFIGTLKRRVPRPRILVVTSLVDSWQLNQILSESVDAVFHKAGPFEGFISRIRALMPDSTADSAPGSPECGKLEQIAALLTAREREVLHALGAGLANKEIADELGISVRTVETHRKNIVSKTNLRGSELFRTAVHFRDRMPRRGGFPETTDRGTRAS